jgi:hypothetical protein
MKNTEVHLWRSLWIGGLAFLISSQVDAKFMTLDGISYVEEDRLSLQTIEPFMKNEHLLQEIKMMSEMEEKKFGESSDQYWEKFSHLFEERMAVCGSSSNKSKQPLANPCGEDLRNDLKQFEKFFLKHYMQGRYRYLLWYQEREREMLKQWTSSFLDEEESLK